MSLIMKIDPTWVFQDSCDFNYSILLFYEVSLYYKTTSWFWFENMLTLPMKSKH